MLVQFKRTTWVNTMEKNLPYSSHYVCSNVNETVYACACWTQSTKGKHQFETYNRPDSSNLFKAGIQNYCECATFLISPRLTSYLYKNSSKQYYHRMSHVNLLTFNQHAKKIKAKIPLIIFSCHLLHKFNCLNSNLFLCEMTHRPGCWMSHKTTSCLLEVCVALALY